MVKANIFKEIIDNVLNKISLTMDIRLNNLIFRNFCVQILKLFKSIIGLRVGMIWMKEYL